jgi:hypothetical protein
MTEEEKLEWFENTTLSQLLFYFYAPYAQKELGISTKSKIDDTG